jgi:hypothetical protein
MIAKVSPDRVVRFRSSPTSRGSKCIWTTSSPTNRSRSWICSGSREVDENAVTVAFVAARQLVLTRNCHRSPVRLTPSASSSIRTILSGRNALICSINGHIKAPSPCVFEIGRKALSLRPSAAALASQGSAPTHPFFSLEPRIPSKGDPVGLLSTVGIRRYGPRCVRSGQ